MPNRTEPEETEETEVLIGEPRIGGRILFISGESAMDVPVEMKHYGAAHRAGLRMGGGVVTSSV